MHSISLVRDARLAGVNMRVIAREDLMPLDYKNLPLLLTIDEVAEMFRCSTGTVRNKTKSDPTWLKPARHALMRKQLFATADVLLLLGHAAPAQLSSPLDATDPWNPELAAAAIDQAKRERIRDQMKQRSDSEIAARDAWAKRVASHAPSARAKQVAWRDRKARLEVSEDGGSFRFWLHFQPRFCPPDWPGLISIPRNGPVWVKLESDDEMERLKHDIDAVMADYQLRWDAFVADRKRQRKTARTSV